MTISTRTAYDRHLDALAARDLDAVVDGYAPDAVLASNAGIGRGHDYVRTVFGAFLASGRRIEPRSVVFEQDEVVYVTWTAGELCGADTFVVYDGLITVHSGFVAVPS